MTEFECLHCRTTGSFTNMSIETSTNDAENPFAALAMKLKSQRSDVSDRPPLPPGSGTVSVPMLHPVPVILYACDESCSCHPKHLRTYYQRTQTRNANEQGATSTSFSALVHSLRPAVKDSRNCPSKHTEIGGIDVRRLSISNENW